MRNLYAFGATSCTRREDNTCQAIRSKISNTLIKFRITANFPTASSSNLFYSRLLNNLNVLHSSRSVTLKNCPQVLLVFNNDIARPRILQNMVNLLC